MDARNIWEAALDAARGKAGHYLVILAAIDGSAPGQPGAKMLVGPGGAVHGTIGGGRIEHELIGTITSRLRQNDPRRLPEILHDPLGSGRQETVTAGGGCSGRATLVLVPLTPESTEVLRVIVQAIRGDDGGTIEVTSAGLRHQPGASQPIAFQSGAGWRYREPLSTTDRLTIIGGGHLSLALSRVVRPLGFHITVIDERERLETLRENRFAHCKVTLPFSEAAGAVPEGADSYVLVMTPDHATDEKIVLALAGKRLRYLGMVASRRKSARIREALRANGVDEEAIGRLHAPIGLPIGSKTPAEIAISIAAELIQNRRAADG